MVRRAGFVPNARTVNLSSYAQPNSVSRAACAGWDNLRVSPWLQYRLRCKRTVAILDALRNDTPMKSLEGDVGVRVGAAGTEDGIQIGIVVQEGLV